MSERKLLEEISKYTDHLSGCEAYAYGGSCSCGLNDLLAAIRALTPEELAAVGKHTGDMVMVPREPTDAMKWAMQNELPDHQNTLGARMLVEAQYQAMLAAAPVAPVAGKEEAPRVSRITVMHAGNYEISIAHDGKTEVRLVMP